jgi:hypothetical protein
MPFLRTGCHRILCRTLLLPLGLVPLTGREHSRRAWASCADDRRNTSPRKDEVRYGSAGKGLAVVASVVGGGFLLVDGDRLPSVGQQSGDPPASVQLGLLSEQNENEKGRSLSPFFIKAPAGATLILGLAWAAHSDAPLHAPGDYPMQSLAMRGPPRLPAWIISVSALPQLDASQSEDAFQSSAKRPTAVWRRLLTVPTGIRSIPAISA